MTTSSKRMLVFLCVILVQGADAEYGMAQELKMKAAQLDRFAAEVLRRSNDARILENTKRLRELFGIREWNFKRGARSANGSLSFVGKYHALFRKQDEWVVRFEPQLVTMPMNDIPLLDLDRFGRADIERIKSYAKTLKENLGEVDTGEITQQRMQLITPLKTSWQGRSYNLQPGEVYVQTRERDTMSAWLQVDGKEIPVPKSHLKNYVEGESYVVRTPRFQGAGFAARETILSLIEDRILKEKDRNPDSPTRSLPPVFGSSPLKLSAVWVPDAAGLRVVKVLPSGLGERIGLQDGDIIFRLNGEGVGSSEEFIAIRDRMQELAIVVNRRRISGERESVALPRVVVRDRRPVILNPESGVGEGIGGGSGGGFGLPGLGTTKSDAMQGRWLVKSGETNVGVMEFLVLKSPSAAVDNEMAYRFTKVNPGGKIDILDGHWSTKATDDGKFTLQLVSKIGGDGKYHVDFSGDGSRAELATPSGTQKLVLVRK